MYQIFTNAGQIHYLTIHPNKQASDASMTPDGLNLVCYCHCLPERRSKLCATLLQNRNNTTARIGALACIATCCNGIAD